MKNAPIVGTSVPRMEGRDKVTGQARYVDDMTLPGMLYGATVRSRIPRGKIKKFTFGPGIDWNEFVIVTPEDIPGKNCIALIEDDQPCLADGIVNHPEEPLLLLAHPDRHLLPKAVEAVSVEYDPLPAIFTMEESEALQQIIWGTDNIFKTYLIEKGDVDAVWQNRRPHRRSRIHHRRAGTALHRKQRNDRRLRSRSKASRCGVRSSVPTTSTKP